MISPTGRGHAPHTQTKQLLMAQPCSGMTAGSGTAGSVGSGKLCHTEKEYKSREGGSFSRSY